MPEKSPKKAKAATKPTTRKTSARKTTAAKKPAPKKAATKKASATAKKPAKPSSNVLQQKGPHSFGNLFFLSWNRLLHYKKQLILPALCSLPFVILQTIGDFAGEGDEGGEVFSFVPKAMAESDMLADDGVVVLIITILATLFIVLLLVNIWAYIYASLVVYDQHKTIRETSKRALGFMIPLLLLGLWITVRSYVWVPIVVIFVSLALMATSAISSEVFFVLFAVSILVLSVLVLYFMPRLALSRVILMTEGTKIKESVELSWQRTEKYWAKIFFNGLLFGICITCIAMFCVAVFAISAIGIAIALAAADVDFTSVGIMAGLIITGLLIAIIFGLARTYMQFWQMCFEFELAQTVFKNPRTAK